MQRTLTHRIEADGVNVSYREADRNHFAERQCL
jgi:hypothetical protein